MQAQAAVWLQDTKNAQKYKDAGINLYVALWKGPTDEQLEALREAGMAVICDQGRAGLAHKDDPTIVGWMHGDEPDNAQEIPGGRDTAPPSPGEDHRRLREDAVHRSDAVNGRGGGTLATVSCAGAARAAPLKKSPYPRHSARSGQSSMGRHLVPRGCGGPPRKR